jgi:hypothetical protein
MKKLLGILVLGLLWVGTAVAKDQELYMRCKAKALSVTGDIDIVKGKYFNDYIFRIIYSNEIDLRKSEKSEVKIKNISVFKVQGKKKKFEMTYKETQNKGLDTITFTDSFETKDFIAFSTMTLNRTGGQPILTGAQSVSEVKEGKVIKYRFSHTGSCKKISKQEFKKPVASYDFKVASKVEERPDWYSLNICKKKKIKECENVGKNLYLYNSIVKRDLKIGPVVGVVYLKKGQDRGTNQVRLAEKNSYYYLIDDMGDKNNLLTVLLVKEHSFK